MATWAAMGVTKAGVARCRFEGDVFAFAARIVHDMAQQRARLAAQLKDAPLELEVTMRYIIFWLQRLHARLAPRRVERAIHSKAGFVNVVHDVSNEAQVAVSAA